MVTKGKHNIVLGVSQRLGVTLRTAVMHDLHELRQWKNTNREFFFHTDEISVYQQQAWFEAYQQRPLDFMFMVLVQEIAIGCMGIRLEDNAWDIYNVILGDVTFGKQGVMGSAFQEMLVYAETLKPVPITLKVLKKNPAVDWYHKQGFVITAESTDYYAMRFDKNHKSLNGKIT